jgi:hypothetical protein
MDGLVLSFDGIQQAIVTGSIEEIDGARRVCIWGRTVGDRIIADVLLYSHILTVDGRTQQLMSPH